MAEFLRRKLPAQTTVKTKDQRGVQMVTKKRVAKGAASRNTMPRPAAKAKKALAGVATPSDGKDGDAERVKRVRDEFSMPRSDYGLLGMLNASAASVGVKVKKNELLRLGLRALIGKPAKELGELILSLQAETAAKKN